MGKLIIANWKMKLSVTETLRLAHEVARCTPGQHTVVICPSTSSLGAVGDTLRKTKIALGAQNCFWEMQGAFTGEVSPQILHELGCRYVILGHSERRQHIGETDDMVHRKVIAALAGGLTPVVCVGETFQQRQDGAADYVLIEQVTRALQGVECRADQQIVVAYEPVWVIGTGRAIEPHEAQNAHHVIRQTLFDIFPVTTVHESIRIIYGGSVDSSNVSTFTHLDSVDGVLVGNASLDARHFQHIIDNA